MFSATLILSLSPFAQDPCCEAGQQQAAAPELVVSSALASIAVAPGQAGQNAPAGQLSFGLTSQGQDGKRRVRTLVLDSDDLKDADLEALFRESGGEMPAILSQIGYAEEDEADSDHGYLGLMIGEAEDGVLIEGVYGNSGAARAGLKAGDVIRRVGKKKVQSIEELIGFVSEREAGSEVRVRVERGDGWMKDTLIELVARDELGEVEEVERQGSGPSARGIGPNMFFEALDHDGEEDAGAPRQMKVQLNAADGEDGEMEIEVHVLGVGDDEESFGIDLGGLEGLQWLKQLKGGEGLGKLKQLHGLRDLGIDLDGINGQMEIHVEVQDDGGERHVEKRVMRFGGEPREAGQGRGDRWRVNRQEGEGHGSGPDSKQGRHPSGWPMFKMGPGESFGGVFVPGGHGMGGPSFDGCPLGQGGPGSHCKDGSGADCPRGSKEDCHGEGGPDLHGGHGAKGHGGHGAKGHGGHDAKGHGGSDAKCHGEPGQDSQHGSHHGSGHDSGHGSRHGSRHGVDDGAGPAGAWLMVPGGHGGIGLGWESAGPGDGWHGGHGEGHGHEGRGGPAGRREHDGGREHDGHGEHGGEGQRDGRRGQDGGRDRDAHRGHDGGGEGDGHGDDVGAEIEQHAREFMERVRERMGRLHEMVEQRMEEFHGSMEHNTRDLEERIEELHHRLRELHERLEER